MTTCIELDEKLHRELVRLRQEIGGEDWNQFFARLITSLPRCPYCNGVLMQKFASNKLICIKCNREYILNPV